MEVSFISYNNDTGKGLDEVTALNNKVSLYDFSGKTDAKTLTAHIKNKDIVIISLEGKDVFKKPIDGYSNVENVNLSENKSLIKVLEFLEVKSTVDSIISVIKETNSKAQIVFAGKVAGIAVGYTYRAHGIKSFGLFALTYAEAVKSLETAFDQKGIKEAIFVGGGEYAVAVDVISEKGASITAEIFAKAKTLKPNIGVLRKDILKDTVASSAFFNTISLPENDKKINAVATSFVSALSEEEAAPFILHTLNEDRVTDFDVQSVINKEFKVSSKGIEEKETKGTLALQSALLLNDTISFYDVAAAAIAENSLERFKRAIKLNDQLMPILTLEELDTLAEKLVEGYNVEVLK